MAKSDLLTMRIIIENAGRGCINFRKFAGNIRKIVGFLIGGISISIDVIINCRPAEAPQIFDKGNIGANIAAEAIDLRLLINDFGIGFGFR